MKSPERRWDELQTRWASGERLSSEDDRQRVDHALDDPLAARELELFAELRARGQGSSDGSNEALVERVLGIASSRRLRLVSADERRGPAPPKVAEPRRLWFGIAAVTVSAAAAAAVLLSLGDRPGAVAVAPAPRAVVPVLARSELVLASGDVKVRGAVARVGAGSLAWGDRVTTGDGRSCLTIDPGVDVCLGKDSSVVLESLTRNDVRIRVETGTAIAALTRREPGHVFSLTAGSVSATAHGTVFAVQRTADSRVEVVVMEGAVDVAHGASARELVSSHSRWVLRSSAEPVERSAIGRGDEARFWALAAPRELWARREVGVLELSSPAPGAEARIDEEGPLDLPLWTFVPAGRRRVALRESSGNESIRFVDVVAGETRQVDLPEAGDGRKSAAPAPSSPAPSAAVLLDAARAELARGNAPAALALYHRLRATYPASAEAKTVAVTVGKLQLDLKQPASALSSFESYLRSGGALAPEALAGKIRALRALGRSPQEKQAIEQYLQRYPSGFEAPLFKKRLEALGAR